MLMGCELPFTFSKLKILQSVVILHPATGYVLLPDSESAASSFRLPHYSRVYPATFS